MALSAVTPALAQAALLVLKSTLLLGAAALGAHALRRASAAARHLVWALALAGMVALPALALFVPDWTPAALAILRPAGEAAGAAEQGSPRVSLALLAGAVWAAGAVVVLARLVGGLMAVRHLGRRAEPVVDPAWTDLLERMGRAAGVRRGVTLLRSPDAAMPLTWGAFRPAILLPACADGWTPERRRVVLLHELAHVARRDCLMQTLAEACCALWWFHPGAWWAAKRMRIEREQACDDQVLAAGARASDYAGHLLAVARGYRAPALAAAVAMARPSHLEGRVRAVLAAERDRRAVTGRTAGLCAGAVLLASLPLAAVSPSARPLSPRAVAWEMPPARSRPGIHGSLTVERPLAARPLAEPARVADAATSPAPSRVARAGEHAPTAEPARVSPRVADGTHARGRSQHHAVRVHTRGVLATLDENGDLRARLRLPEGIQVRVEGHGVRSVGAEVRVELNVGRAISLLTQHGAAESKRGESVSRERSPGERRKVAGEVSREMVRDKHDLAQHILAGVNADADGDEDESTAHPTGKAAAEETAGGV